MIASIRKARMALGNHHTHVLLFQRLLVQLYLTSILVSRLLAEIVFEVLRFTSRSFTELFTRNGIPSSINVEQIEKAGADYTIYRKLDELIKSVNANDGFGILGWIHIGLKNYVYSTDGGKVRSSDMVRHVTRGHKSARGRSAVKAGVSEEPIVTRSLLKRAFCQECIAGRRPLSENYCSLS